MLHTKEDIKNPTEYVHERFADIYYLYSAATGEDKVKIKNSILNHTHCLQDFIKEDEQRIKRLHTYKK